MLLEFQNKMNFKMLGFQLMHFGFAIDSSDIDLRDLDYLDTDLDMLVTDLDFVCLQDALKTSAA